MIRSNNCRPSFLGYHGFPASICTSPNEVIVHGIPDRSKLKEGDLLSIDAGAIYDGWHGDAAITVGVGELDEPVAALVAACERSLAAGEAHRAVAGLGAAVEHRRHRERVPREVIHQRAGLATGQQQAGAALRPASVQRTAPQRRHSGHGSRHPLV